MAGWPPQKIRAELVLRGKKQTEIARTVGVSSCLVSLVIKGNKVSRRVRAEIARTLKAKVTDIWPAA